MAKALGAKTVFHEGMDACSSADALRAAQYNNMIRMVIAALNQGWLRNLTHSQRRGLLDALNWFHTKDLLAIEKDNRAVFVPVADGFWPSDEMSLGAAQDIFAELESLKWLRIERLQLNTPMATTSKATYP